MTEAEKSKETRNKINNAISLLGKSGLSFDEISNRISKAFSLNVVVSTCCYDSYTALKNKIRLADIDRCAK